MEDFKVNVDKVVSFDDFSNESAAILRLKDAGAFTVERKDRRYDVWSRVFKESLASGRVLYIESDPATGKVQNAYLPSLHQIDYVAPEPEGDRLKVILLMAPSLYFLKTTRRNYKEMRRVLEESVQNKNRMLVTAHPDTQEILDVRNQ